MTEKVNSALVQLVSAKSGLWVLLVLIGYGVLSLQQHAVEMAGLRGQVRGIELRMERLVQELGRASEDRYRGVDADRDFAALDRRLDDLGRRLEVCEGRFSGRPLGPRRLLGAGGVGGLGAGAGLPEADPA